MIFQNRGRPQGNTNKNDKPSIFKKSPPAGSQTKTTNSLFTKRPFTTQNMESEMAMDLCIDEKDEERESEAQSDVRAKKRAPPNPPFPLPHSSPRARLRFDG